MTPKTSMSAEVVPHGVLHRLREAGLKPTVARIGVLQLLEASGSHGLGAEEVFQQLIARGVRTGLGTVYRALHELHAGELLTRQWGQRKALYRARLQGEDTRAVVRLVCPDSGRSVVLGDARLLAALKAAAARHGVDLRGCALTVAGERVERQPVPRRSNAPGKHGAPRDIRATPKHPC